MLIDAWASNPAFPMLKIIGDGPQAEWLQTRIATLPNVVWLGRLPREQVLEAMKTSKALILPSVWYENFPVTIVEAYATGLPVIVSDAGTLPELVRVGSTGFVFQSGNSASLAASVQQMECAPERYFDMKEATRATFKNSYGEDRNYLLLLSIYRNALNQLNGITKEPPRK